MCLQDRAASRRSIVVAYKWHISILTFRCIWTSWEKLSLSDAQYTEDVLSLEADICEQKLKGFNYEREILHNNSLNIHACRFTRSLLLPSFLLNLLSNLSETTTEESVNMFTALSSGAFTVVLLLSVCFNKN